ncbi:MAG TPA: UTP--glucose-1-phosphate uridylyltransferase [Candidatus Saccharimonas sp.]|nr:UTP--glucose-1-phosphate uridylyltransferase [Candidatus Saccharimonas sp.]
MTKITKAVIPAAGLGTRFLPQTKAMPKEMLPVIDKPIIQYVVEEVVAAGITDIIIVTGAHKRSVEDHFDHQYELEARLDRAGKGEVADQLRSIAEMANFIYVRQKPLVSDNGTPIGNGVPILNAAHLLGDEPFLVMWADEVFVGPKPRAVQLVEAYDQLQAPVISLIPIEADKAKNYGMASVAQDLGHGLLKLDGIVEKPAGEPPSAYASIGGYVLTPDIFRPLEDAAPHADGEIYLTTAITSLAKSGTVYGQVLEGTWHDTGNKQKYLECIADIALADPDLGPGFASYLKKRLQ